MEPRGNGRAGAPRTGNGRNASSRTIVLHGPRPAARVVNAGAERLNHDLVVIGASAGGLSALQTLLPDLPARLPAAVLVVVHMGGASLLPEILRRDCALPVQAAVSGAPIRPGHVHVAVPGRHLLVHDAHLLLRRGPRENLARPAVDALFRTAACSFGARVIGVVLSGALNDGTAGLRAIKRCGGLAVVQDPGDAAVPAMPESALRYVAVDHVAPAAAMGRLLARLVAAPPGPAPEAPEDIRLEAAIAMQELATMSTEDRLGTLSPFTCPECHGALWEIEDGDLLRYRCHVGHSFTGAAMLVEQTRRVDETLWGLMRAHRERAALARRLADRESSVALANELRRRATDYDEDAEILNQLIAGQTEPPGSPAEDEDAGG